MDRIKSDEVIKLAEKIVFKYDRYITPRCSRNQLAKLAAARRMWELGEYMDAAGRAYQAIGLVYRSASRNGRL